MPVCFRNTENKGQGFHDIPFGGAWKIVSVYVFMSHQVTPVADLERLQAGISARVFLMV